MVAVGLATYAPSNLIEIIMNKSPLQPNFFKDAQKFFDRNDPLSGPNIMRRADTLFTDNADGTMTLRRPAPYYFDKAESTDVSHQPSALVY